MKGGWKIQGKLIMGRTDYEVYADTTFGDIKNGVNC